MSLERQTTSGQTQLIFCGVCACALAVHPVSGSFPISHAESYTYASHVGLLVARLLKLDGVSRRGATEHTHSRSHQHTGEAGGLGGRRCGLLLAVARAALSKRGSGVRLAVGLRVPEEMVSRSRLARSGRWPGRAGRRGMGAQGRGRQGWMEEEKVGDRGREKTVEGGITDGSKRTNSRARSLPIRAGDRRDPLPSRSASAAVSGSRRQMSCFCSTSPPEPSASPASNSFSQSNVAATMPPLRLRDAGHRKYELFWRRNIE